jgi:uncharacterized protein
VIIWIDADAAPFEVKEIIFRAARRLNVETILVANQPMALPGNAPMVKAIAVREGANMADRYIAAHASGEDIVITADIPLAGDLVANSITVIDPRGEIYSADNIAARLSVRNFMDELRGAGQTLRGNRPYDARHKQAFASALDRALTRALRRERMQKPTSGINSGAAANSNSDSSNTDDTNSNTDDYNSNTGTSERNTDNSGSSLETGNREAANPDLGIQLDDANKPSGSGESTR